MCKNKLREINLKMKFHLDKKKQLSKQFEMKFSHVRDILKFLGEQNNFQKLRFKRGYERRTNIFTAKPIDSSSNVFLTKGLYIFFLRVKPSKIQH